MQKERKAERRNAQPHDLPEDLVEIAHLVGRAMPMMSPPDAFERSLRVSLLAASAESLGVDTNRVGRRSFGLRFLVGAAATVSLIGAGLIIRRSHVLDEMSPSIASMLNRGDAQLGSRMAEASR
ncbi:MAG: hypothetical protein EXR50_05775 [Dehalococcoidia bacterium]|nr:hypothetical protein [Dehalococcoidia bacterium]